MQRLRAQVYIKTDAIRLPCDPLAVEERRSISVAELMHALRSLGTHETPAGCLVRRHRNSQNL